MMSEVNPLECIFTWFHHGQKSSRNYEEIHLGLRFTPTYLLKIDLASMSSYLMDLFILNAMKKAHF